MAEDEGAKEKAGRSVIFLEANTNQYVYTFTGLTTELSNSQMLWMKIRWLASFCNNDYNYEWEVPHGWESKGSF